MSKLMVIKCPNCGGSVDYDHHLNKGICSNCGNPVILDRDVPSVVNITKVVTESSRFYAIFYQLNKEFKLIAKNDLIIKGEYRKDAAYGERNSLKISVSSNGSPLDLKMNCNNIPTERVQFLFEDGNFFVNSECKKPIFINGSMIPFNDFTVGFGDLIRYGDVILRMMPINRNTNKDESFDGY